MADCAFRPSNRVVLSTYGLVVVTREGMMVAFTHCVFVRPTRRIAETFCDATIAGVLMKTTNHNTQYCDMEFNIAYHSL